MGGRGAFQNSKGGGINVEYREYKAIDKIGHIKVLIWTEGENNKTITFSNTPNTTYYSADKYGRIEKIYYYRDHRLIKSVDFKRNETPHTHYWSSSGSVVGRKEHDPNNTFPLNERDIKLWKTAVKYNKEHGFT